MGPFPGLSSTDAKLADPDRISEINGLNSLNRLRDRSAGIGAHTF
jgi:hypothetical protein